MGKKFKTKNFASSIQSPTHFLKRNSINIRLIPLFHHSLTYTAYQEWVCLHLYRHAIQWQAFPSNLNRYLGPSRLTKKQMHLEHRFLATKLLTGFLINSKEKLNPSNSCNDGTQKTREVKNCKLLDTTMKYNPQSQTMTWVTKQRYSWPCPPGSWKQTTNISNSAKQQLNS